MTAVVFHLIDDPDPEAYWYYAAELCAQAAASEQMLYVVFQDHDQLEYFDEYLWGYRSDAFVPHTADPEDSAHAPVFLGVDAVAGGFDAVLNLSDRLIERVADRVQVDEVVDADPARRARARDRWRSYQAQGVTLQHRPVALVPRAED
ncbi:DNA polymerase III subunit chi [Halothiobacillus sp. DCM-1]|uniref:DNA polymerase III subunit chi n=1 Tax=Halothiobacillus sp. DCM-1 TaxID=3112558 RepID=UPI00324E9C7D